MAEKYKVRSGVCFIYNYESHGKVATRVSIEDSF